MPGTGWLELLCKHVPDRSSTWSPRPQKHVHDLVREARRQADIVQKLLDQGLLVSQAGKR